MEREGKGKDEGEEGPARGALERWGAASLSVYGSSRRRGAGREREREWGESAAVAAPAAASYAIALTVTWLGCAARGVVAGRGERGASSGERGGGWWAALDDSSQPVRRHRTLLHSPGSGERPSSHRNRLYGELRLPLKYPRSISNPSNSEKTKKNRDKRLRLTPPAVLGIFACWV